MDINTIFFTQIATIIAFVVTTFILYRLLVKQKDSTIELLKEKSIFLELQLSEAKNQTPDLLVENISKRVKLVNEELERLSHDKENNEALIEEKKQELSDSKNELIKLRVQFDKAEELINEFFCPYCKAPMISREFAWESVEYNGKDIDVDHERTLFECGLELIDGAEGTKCGGL